MPAEPRRADRRGDHLIVCGDGPLSYRITEELTSRYGEHVTVILPDRRNHHGPQISALPRVRVLEYPELSSQAFTDADVQSAGRWPWSGRTTWATCTPGCGRRS